jgi:hypothetical protein
MNKTFWYDPDRTLSHNCIVNLILGNRGCGKSYGWCKKVIKRFKKDGKKFIYLRRYTSELEKVQETIFKAIIKNGEFEGDKIEYKGGCFYINDEVFGYCFSLSTANDWKSSSYPDVWCILYDECLIDDRGKSNGYLKDEPGKILDLMETINRMRDGNDTIKMIMLGNTISMTNPFTLAWNLKIPKNKSYQQLSDLILFEIVLNPDYIEAKKKTRLGRLMMLTNYGEYAIEGKFMLDSPEFIERKSGNCNYFFTLRYDGTNYGIWLSYTQGKIWVSENVDPSCRMIYTLKQDDHTENTILIKSIRNCNALKTFIDAYRDGAVRFENQKLKNITTDIIKTCLL